MPSYPCALEQPIWSGCTPAMGKSPLCYARLRVIAMVFEPGWNLRHALPPKKVFVLRHILCGGVAQMVSLS